MVKQIIRSPIEVGDDNFGHSLSISNNGWLAVGANCNGVLNGIIYIYNLKVDKWVNVYNITENLIGFGYSVSLNNDGTKLVVNNSSYGTKNTEDSVIITYELSEKGYTEINRFKLDRISVLTSMSKDGLVLAIGKYSLSDDYKIEIYHWNDVKKSWTYKHTIELILEIPFSNIKISTDELGETITASIIDLINGNNKVFVFRWSNCNNKYILANEIKATIKTEESLYGVSTSITNYGKNIYTTFPNFYNEEIKIYNGIIYNYVYDELKGEYILTDMESPSSLSDTIMFGYTLSVSKNYKAIKQLKYCNKHFVNEVVVSSI